MGVIVAGFIDNPEGHQALDLAIEEARLRNATLCVVHSMQGGERTSGDDVLRYREALDRVAARLTREAVDHEIHEYVRGHSPADDLITAAREFGADLIVIGYRRRSAAGKAFLGSHAQDVLMGSDCPVLAIRAPEPPGTV